MFVHQLGPRQQSALLHYARELMRADGRIGDDELGYLDALRAQTVAGVEAEEIPLEKIGHLFTDRRSRVALLLELIGMGYADESFEVEEASLITQISNALDFSDEDVLDFKSWVRRQMMLMTEAEHLMEA